jgi:two-component system, NarL family, sensor kinase
MSCELRRDPADDASREPARVVLDFPGESPPAVAPSEVRAGPEIAMLDEDGLIVAVNHAWRSSTATRRLAISRSGIGVPYFDVARMVVPALEEAAFRKALADLASGARREILHRFAIETDRGPRWRQVQITPLRIGAAIRYVAIHEDLTELVVAQEALRRTSEQLLTAQDDERSRIAIELHDSTSQHLAVLGLGLAQLRSLVDGPRAQLVIAEMRRSLEDAVRETRVLSYLMKPSGLVQEGLVTTARRFAEGLARRTGLSIRFEAEGPVDDTPAPVQHAAFRIVQEALSNVHRHAGAKAAEVRLFVNDGAVTVRVSDDGRGMPGQPLDGSGDVQLGVGISGMRARVHQLGGRLAIDSDATGTRVTALLPIIGEGLSATRTG